MAVEDVAAVLPARDAVRRAPREAAEVPAGLPALPGLAADRDEAFRACFREHYGALAGYCAALVGNSHLAHDIAQESFTRLFSRWIGVREPRAYVYWIATNLVREHWRRGRTERTALATLRIAGRDEVEEHDPWLRDLVERLPERHRQVVLLHYYADLPLQEVAALVHRPLGTVKRSLHEARAMLLAAVAEGENA